jgi:hypothetical protein
LTAGLTLRQARLPTLALRFGQKAEGLGIIRDPLPGSDQDFHGILKTPSTQTQQIVQPSVPKLPTFRRLTLATAYQKRAFELLQFTM